MEKSEIEQRKLLRDEKIRQQLRINSPELREFQSKLLTDSVKKHREYQMAEKTVRDLEKQNLVKILAEQREIKQQQDNHLEEMNMIAEFNRKKKYNHVLQDQLEDKHRLYEKMKEEFEQEKIKAAAMRLVMKEEYEKNDLLKKIQQNAFKKEIDNFKASQVELRKKIEEEEKVAERKIKEYQNEKITRENKKMEEQNRRNYVLNTVQQQLAEQIEKETRKKLELEKLQQDLHLAEQEAMDIYKEQNEMEKKINNKLYMQWSNECYQLEKAEKEKTEKELEQQFHDMMLNKFAKRDKLEAMNAQARKMKQIDHLKIIEKMIEEKKMKEKIEKEQTLADKAEEEQTEEIRQRMIEEEKLKILEKIQESFDSYQRIAISPEYKWKCLEQDSNR